MIEQKKIGASLKKIVVRAAMMGCLALSLQGCIEMAIGTALVSTLAATDRRTFGAQTDDKGIVFKGEARIAKLFPDAHVNVTSFNRRVLLTGEVADEAMKQAIERDIAGIDGVLAVANELAVGAVSNYTSRSNDALLTTKVKASFVDRQGLSANAFKVVTENGAVYLMGRVTAAEGKLGGEVASGVSGVRKVIKLFEYISDEELKKITLSS